ncbi:ABC transporter permease [Vibrio aphrogenes]|uniref:ABC transporter permease n=1 Tax=Vibrio aphrogenes TaxID=1891186 RepID=UPI001E2880D5|nr:thiamine ABC transporter permease [Vibrio aphrogenes]
MQSKPSRLLRLSYIIVILICILPLLPGIAGMILPAFGIIPPLGFYQLSSQGFSEVLAWPGVERSLLQSVFSALLSCFMACMMTFAILQAYWNTRRWQWIEKLLSPLLALPHVAFAVGFLFLFSDTGWLARLLHTFITSSWFNSIYSLQDNSGLALTLALAIKETPFLILMSVPILNNLNITPTLQMTQSLGYSYSQAWWKAIFPQWLQHIRFPLFAIMAYSASVVDVSLILGPTHPPTFAVLVWQWFNDPDLTLLPRAAAGAFILFLLCSALIGVIALSETLLLHHHRAWLVSGRRHAMTIKPYFLHFLIAVSLCTLPILLIWSFSLRWSFPNLLPTLWSTRFWVSEWPYIQQTIITSLSLALISSLFALILAIIAQEYRHRFQLHLPMYVIALPMLIPQLSILFGLQITSLWIDQEQYWLWVIWAHLFFAFPYVYLSLDGPWKSYNDSLSKIAISLGKTPLKVFFTIKLRLLAGAMLFAFAMGMSVSLAQYLPTISLGSGRIVTLTTEAVALSSGHDRRIVSLYALWQALLPFAFFMIAMIGNRMLSPTYRNPTHSQKD